MVDEKLKSSHCLCAKLAWTFGISFFRSINSTSNNNMCGCRSLLNQSFFSAPSIL